MPINPLEELHIIQRDVITANQTYPEDLAAPQATTKQRQRIRLAIQQVIPDITDEDRYAVTAILGRYRRDLFLSTQVLTVGAASAIIQWMYGNTELITESVLLERAICTIRYCYNIVTMARTQPIHSPAFAPAQI